LCRVAKTEQKAVAKELEMVSSTLEELKNSKPEHSVAVAEITRLVGRFQGLKRKLEAFDEETGKSLDKATFRMSELAKCDDRPGVDMEEDGAAAATRAPAFESEWERKRMDRIIAEHLAREGLWDSASGLVEQSQLQDYVDIGIFLESRPIIEALKVLTGPNSLPILVQSTMLSLFPSKTATPPLHGPIHVKEAGADPGRTANSKETVDRPSNGAMPTGQG